MWFGFNYRKFIGQSVDTDIKKTAKTGSEYKDQDEEKRVQLDYSIHSGLRPDQGL